jgi:hypothetical protein
MYDRVLPLLWEMTFADDAPEELVTEMVTCGAFR